MSQHVEAALLDVIDKGDEAHAAARVGNHEEDLRSPELDVVLPDVQHQKVFTYLQGGGNMCKENRFFPPTNVILNP